MLGTEPRNPQTYAAGALLENGSRLVEIHADHVVLEREGRRITLFVGREADSVSAGRPERSGKSLFGWNSLKTSTRKDADSDLAMVGGSGPVSTVVRATSVDTVANAIRAQPLFQNGALAGFELQPGTNVALFKRLGLEAGDVIHFVDGKRITDDAQWREIAGALARGASIPVTVGREGQLQHLSLDGSALADEPARAAR